MAGYGSVAVIGGPTACGKSGIAIQVSLALNGEIICADSMQIYYGVTVGTASPSGEDLKKVPHHLYGYVAPETEFNLFEYQTSAYKAMDDIISRNRLPVLCGGTGLYISSLIEGINLPDSEIDHDLRNRLEKEYDENPEEIFRRLEQLDPGASKITHLNNKKRVIRYLELYYSTGKTYSERAVVSHSNDMDSKYDYTVFILEPDRKWLRRRISDRIDIMKNTGLIEEANEVFIHRNEWKTLAQAIGFKELFPYFNGTAALENCLEDLKTATYHYAKRQHTWFKRINGAEIIHVESEKDLDNAVSHITEILMTGRPNEKQ